MSKTLKISALLLCVVLALSLFGFASCFDTPVTPDKPNPDTPGGDTKPTGTPLAVYSSKIASVYDVAMLTGPLGKTDTLTEWGIGGTDLGFPYYDEASGKMMFLFGDTFSSVNGGSSGWRSNVLGITSDLDASDGIVFDEFAHNVEGMAKQIIDSRHDTSNNGEYTSIPTGGIAINGVHYVFYMAIKDWQNNTWNVNYCNVAKSTDGGKNFTKMSNLYWVNEPSKNPLAQTNVCGTLNVTAEEANKHVSSGFMQIFPYAYQEYVYLFGLPSGRGGGVKLGRVKAAEIEQFDKYQYYYGGEWYTGSAGLAKVKDEMDENSYIVMPSVGEVCVSYNKYLGKHMMTYYTNNKVVFRTSSDLISWSKSETIVTNTEFLQLYGGFTHEKYTSDDGKTVYLFLSKWYNYADGADKTGYNVRVLSFTLK